MSDLRGDSAARVQSAESPAPILTLTNVSKRYRGRSALNGISLRLYPGELLGFFGPNGAGKTTMIRCLCGLVKPDSGTIVRGVPAAALPTASPSTRSASPATGPPIRFRLGLVPQNLAVYGDLTVQQNLEVFGRLEGVAGRELRDRIAEVLEWSVLADRRHSLARTLSGGMQRRLNIACSVLHRPSVLLLDEPTVGVDPQSRERIYEMMGDLSRQGTGVLLTTHQLEEVETRCDRIVVMDQGTIVADGQLNELVRQTLGRPHRIHLQFDRPCAADLADFEFDPSRTTATCALDSMRDLPRLLAVLEQLEDVPAQIDVRSFGLQDVFLQLTGRSLRE
jgi:ABC-2 type transport system ATP-binding protein